MKNALYYSFGLALAVAFGSWVERHEQSQIEANQQEKLPPVEDTKNTPEATKSDPEADRLAKIERRLDAVERIVFATAKITTVDAERRLLVAEEQARESRQLFLKGFVAEARWQQDQFAVEILRRELDLLRTQSQQQRAVVELEVLQAKKDLQLAEDQLNYTQNLATRGFASSEQVRESRQFVADAKQRLSLASEKLKAAEELEAVAADKTPKMEAEKKK